MPHSRPRHILPVLLKKLKFSPVVAIQGARQTGKSFLVRELLKASLKSLEYVSLDRDSSRQFATTNPETFLSQHESASPFAIDEAQKAPGIFDAVKFSVDQFRKPGRFLLLGSTEFSKLSQIRESLTGRMSRTRLYSLNLAETHDVPPNSSKNPLLLNEKCRFNRAQWSTYLDRGGMPGIFAVRNSERDSLLRDWLELSTHRDALLFPRLKIDPDLCLRIVERIALSESNDAGSIAKSLKRDLRRVKTHLEVLKTLFVIHPLDPHPSGAGKTLYFLSDVSFARLLGASFERQIHTWVLQEQLSQRSYRDDRETKLYYYSTPRAKHLQLIAQSGTNISALKIFSEERIFERDQEILHAFAEKNPEAKVSLFALGPERFTFKAGKRHTLKVEMYPWESMG